MIKQALFSTLYFIARLCRVVGFPLAAMLLCFSATSFASTATSSEIPKLDWRIIQQYPHQPAAFTQGLELYHGRLLETSGRYGQSKFFSRPFPPKDSTPAEVRGFAFPPQWFAEGLTIYQGKIYVLSWRAQRGLIIDPEHFSVLGQFSYRGQGWGLCYHRNFGGEDGAFVMSNGSEQLQWYSPKNIELLKQTPVEFNGQPLDKLNELECHGDYILANRWLSNDIVIIEAASGKVIAKLDLSALVAQEQLTWNSTEPPKTQRRDAVLNGIAYDSEDDSWLVTGKLWRHIYRLRFSLPNTASK
ncbi:glutaminyl-peptide cyclotransferase [Spongiibacter sp. KMU-158]|uniref:Glutaminyl-peptide cyclotransferase n=1 Tax=Spongiibacter pelagi TaxID=2760804 RepID=A0A927GVK2_9GAMM|nr:glutaminyl-peptide cyclotransferase [Spongiibacter pelagi]MBD2858485.1 glutaminyl-peptide cyclotransferase [Spongiibacter pelagi]